MNYQDGKLEEVEATIQDMIKAPSEYLKVIVEIKREDKTDADDKYEMLKRPTSRYAVPPTIRILNKAQKMDMTRFLSLNLYWKKVTRGYIR